MWNDNRRRKSTRILITCAFISLIALALFCRSVNRSCYLDQRAVCGGNVAEMLGSAYYRPFKVRHPSLINTKQGFTHLEDQLSKSTIDCRYHGAQIGYFTRELRKQKLFNKYTNTGTILLQYRHDSMISLPGGGIRAGETVIEGLHRELKEELNLRNSENYTYQISYYNENKHYCGHLFTQEKSWQELHDTIKTATTNPDLGIENLGYMFLPTLIESEDEPGYDGFPTFLAQAIAPKSPPTLVGNTMQQLLFILSSATDPPMLQPDYIKFGFMKACQLIQKSVCSSSTKQKPNGATLANFDQ